MSEDNNSLEAAQTVTITPDDCVSSLEFWKHFNIPISASLQEAFDTFIKDPSYANQINLRGEVTKEISTSEHEAFKDEMFKTIAEECRDVAYGHIFDKQLEETLSVDNKG